MGRGSTIIQLIFGTVGRINNRKTRGGGMGVVTRERWTPSKYFDQPIGCASGDGEPITHGEGCVGWFMRVRRSFAHLYLSSPGPAEHLESGSGWNK